MWNASRFCVSSLRRGHANLLCIIPILVYVQPKLDIKLSKFTNLQQNVRLIFWKPTSGFRGPAQISKCRATDFNVPCYSFLFRSMFEVHYDRLLVQLVISFISSLIGIYILEIGICIYISCHTDHILSNGSVASSSMVNTFLAF